jgi:hypothetical protein
MLSGPGIWITGVSFLIGGAQMPCRSFLWMAFSENGRLVWMDWIQFPWYIIKVEFLIPSLL